MQRSTGFILAGNHRWKALKAKGATHVPVVWADVDDDTARRIMLADNRISDLGAYDPAAFHALAAALPDSLLDALKMREQPDDDSDDDWSDGGGNAPAPPETCSICLDYTSDDDYAEAVHLFDVLRAHHGVATNGDLLWDLLNE